VVSFLLLIAVKFISGGLDVENKEFFFLTTSYNAIEKDAEALQLAANMTVFDAKIDFF